MSIQPTTSAISELTPSSIAHLASTLLAKASTLLSEVTALQTALNATSLPPARHIKTQTFAANVRSEVRLLERCLASAQNVKLMDGDAKEGTTDGGDSGDDEGNKKLEQIHVQLKSSNLPFYLAIWAATRALPRPTALLPSAGNGARKSEPAAPSVVSDAGGRWVKIQAITERRLRADLRGADMLGEELWSEEEGDEDGEGGSGSEDRDEPMHAVYRGAKGLVAAAARTRVRYRRPSVEVWLVNVPRPPADDISDRIGRLMRKVEGLGVKVLYKEDIPQSSLPFDEWLRQTISTVTEIIHYHPNPITQKVILDCTILISLTSDISHRPYPTGRFDRVGKPLYRDARTQLEDEREVKLFRDYLLPMLKGRELYVTQSTRDKFYEILGKMGSAGEVHRASVLFDGTWEEYRSLSIHSLPQDTAQGLLLPLRHIDIPPLTSSSDNDHKVDDFISQFFIPLNRDVFHAGYRLGWTIISQNGDVHKMVERLEGQADAGPDMLFVRAGRSLLGDLEILEEGFDRVENAQMNKTGNAKLFGAG